MAMKKTEKNTQLDAESVARAFREVSSENERLYRESEARIGLSLKLRLLRHEQRLSQAALADRIGRKQPFIARLEQGGYDRCSSSTLRTIVRALGFDFDYDKMFRKLNEPQYSGHSSCDLLEDALEVDAQFAQRLAKLASVRWAVDRGEMLVPGVFQEDAERGVTVAA
jgi:transcriptional regulator with XRE-family HTH domain